MSAQDQLFEQVTPRPRATGDEHVDKEPAASRRADTVESSQAQFTTQEEEDENRVRHRAWCRKEVQRALSESADMFMHNRAAYETAGAAIAFSKLEAARTEEWIKGRADDIMKTEQFRQAERATFENEDAAFSAFVTPPSFTFSECTLSRAVQVSCGLTLRAEPSDAERGRESGGKFMLTNSEYMNGHPCFKIDKANFDTALDVPCQAATVTDPSRKYEGQMRLNTREPTCITDLVEGKKQLASRLEEGLDWQLSECEDNAAWSSAAVRQVKDYFMAAISETQTLGLSQWDAQLPDATSKHYALDVKVDAFPVTYPPANGEALDEGLTSYNVRAKFSYRRYSMAEAGGTCSWSKDPALKFQLEHTVWYQSDE